MVPELEKGQRVQKRGGKKKGSRRHSVHAIEPHPLREGRNGEVVDNRPPILREAQRLTEDTERMLLPRFESFSNNVCMEENFFSGQSFTEAFSQMDDVIHPNTVPCKNSEVKDWINNPNAPYFYNPPHAYEASSSDAQMYSRDALGPRDYYESERRLRVSNDVTYQYGRDPVFDVNVINETIARAQSHRREVAERGFEEEHTDLVPGMEALTLNRPTLKTLRRHSASVGARDASEYKQPRGIRKR
ncbi:hypothetical protein TWF481_011675 [Arthrobotrys musiformis]|uniref:Uncharacterized protein n=1 Tax=Arthrobotrys musiformis TaxID=47236 RepID=A0AAV9W0Y4_9PEZI